jgi:tetratricopeptide (TPR) repeat protein
MNWEVWGPPLAVLGFGLIVGGLFSLRGRGDRRQDHLVDGQARLDSLLDTLRSLEADRVKLSAAVFADRRARLLDKAATALRDLEATRANPPQTSPSQISEAVDASAAPIRWQRSVVWVGVVVLFFGGLTYWLSEFSGVRTEGGSLTGTALSGQALRDEWSRADHEALEIDPDDMVALNRLAHMALEEGDYGQAMTYLDRSKQIDPQDAEVQTHLAILQIAVGMVARAETVLNAAIAANPELSEALLWRGMLLLRKGEREGAITWLERALEAAKTRDDRRVASRALLEARRPPAVEHLRGALTVAPGAGQPAGGVVFVMVRRSADGGGPPAAAVRLNPRGLPGSFAVTDRDLMMGGAWPEQVWIDARWDSDGNPTTRSPDDLVSEVLGPLASGTKDIALVLDGGAASEPEASDAKLQGRLVLAEGASPPAGGKVFVIVRRTEVPAGPPAAALRLETAAVPGGFRVGESDLMMGGEWPAKVWVQARWDADGNAMTKDESDLESPVLGPFDVGALDIVLTLGG